MTEISPKTCVVTGGAGFIGSHLCDALLGLGHKVICIDNLLTGSEKNIELAKQNPNFSFLRHDIVESVPNISGRVDYVFNLASPASPMDFKKLAEEIALVNSIGTVHMLQLAQIQGARYVEASTSEVYGDPKEHPQKETYFGNVNPNGVRACYDESKRFAEAITMVYVRKYNLDARIIRIFNTYGPRMRKDDGRVVSNFINQALEGKPLTVFGDGTQTRSFCYVSDLVAGILAIMLADNLKGEVFNLGNPEEYTVKDLAQKIKALTHSASPITFEALPEDDPTQRKPDITKAKTKLGWEAKVSVDEGLKKTIEYYRK
jgi:nucleoside-diphosphate-sugar epimerase